MTIAEYKCAALRRKEFLVVDKPAENAGFLLVFEFPSAMDRKQRNDFPRLVPLLYHEFRDYVEL